MLGLSLLFLFGHYLLAPNESAQDAKSNDPGETANPSRVQENRRHDADLWSDEAYRENASDDLETNLMKEKIRAALMEVAEIQKRVEAGQDQVSFLFEAQKRLIDALLEFHDEQAIVISILEKNVEMAKRVEANRKRRADQGVGRMDEYAQSKYFRADAELLLFRRERDK